MTNLIYFSNVSNNTARFVEKLGLDALRIPVLAKEQPLYATEPFVLITPTYGGGVEGSGIKGAVPIQVRKFLAVEQNRNLARGVISAGNTNFGEYFAVAGDVLALKLKIPFLYRFEIMGTPDDVVAVREGLYNFWKAENVNESS